MQASATDAIAEQAAAWIVLLTDDDGAERARAQAGFAAWKLADPRHAAAAADMERLIGQLGDVRGHAGGSARPARAALGAAFAQGPRTKRSQARRSAVTLAVALAALLALPAWLTLASYPPAYLMADVRASTGQWPTRTLSDGSRITLSGASAVNLHIDERRRTVELVQGEILVDVAKDATRPFVVETPQGSIRALGTRFVVARQGQTTVLSMLESSVSVQSAAREATIVGAGQRVAIGVNGVDAAESIDTGSIDDAWRLHQLVVNNRPLPEVLEQLNRHRAGRIQFDRAGLDGIRVSAVLPLDDTDRALQLLLNNYPSLRMRKLTPYLVLVDAPEKR